MSDVDSAGVQVGLDIETGEFGNEACAVLRCGVVDRRKG